MGAEIHTPIFTNHTPYYFFNNFSCFPILLCLNYPPTPFPSLSTASLFPSLLYCVFFLSSLYCVQVLYFFCLFFFLSSSYCFFPSLLCPIVAEIDYLMFFFCQTDDVIDFLSGIVWFLRKWFVSVQINWTKVGDAVEGERWRLGLCELDWRHGFKAGFDDKGHA